MTNRIDQALIDQVLSATDMVQLVGDYVTLKKAGRNYFGLCPFHDERTPSFSVTPEKQLYYCFSCGRGGNAIGFIMEMETCSFSQALKKLADRANLSIADQIEVKGEAQQATDPAIAILTQAIAFFRHTFMHTAGGEKARNYVKKRGTSEDLQELFQMGYAPANRLLLSSILPKEAMGKPDLMEASGLFVPPNKDKASPEWVSRFYDRLIIPLRNEHGQVVALSGRRLGQEEDGDPLSSAKYLNSPETRLFHKGHFLFNLDLAKKAIRSQQEVLLLEGYMDVISVFGAGIKQTVASMGTSLTSEQVQHLKKLTSTFILGYDGDQAGQKATDRAINLLLSMGVEDIYVLPLPEGMDPDEYIQHYGPDAFHQHYRHKRESFVDFYIRFYGGQFNLENAADKEAFLNKILPKLHYQSPISRNLSFQQLSDLVHLPVSVLEESYQLLPKWDKEKVVKTKAYSQESLSPLPQVLTKHERAQHQLLFRLMTDEGTWAMIQGQDLSFPDENLQVLYWFLEDYHKSYQAPFHPPHLLTFLPSGEMSGLVTGILSHQYPKETTEEEVKDLLQVITNGYQLEKDVKQLKEAIKEASRQGDWLQAKELAQQLVTTIRHFHHLEG